MVSPISIVIPTVIVTVAVIPNPPCASEGKITARGVTAGASTSLRAVARIMGVNVGIEPSALYVDRAVDIVAHSDRQAGKNFIVDLFGEQSRSVSRPSAGRWEALKEKTKTE